MIPLLFLTAAIALGQGILYATHVVAPYTPDSVQYLKAAHDIVTSGHLVDTIRTPGYPLFLVLVFALRGGAQDQQAVFIAQTALTVLASYEVYLLVYRLSRSPWMACLVASIISLNIYALDWEFIVRNETFTYWLLITLFLLIERLLRQVRIGTALGFSALSFLLIMTRPFYVAFPAILVGAIALRSLWLREGRKTLVIWSGALLLLYSGVVGYMALNWSLNGYFGLSNVGSGNLVGKLIEYRMYDLPVSPDLQPFQRDLVSYVVKGDPAPWPFLWDGGYGSDNFALPDQFSHYVISHYPLQFAGYTVRDAVRVWLAYPALYAQGTENSIFTFTRFFSRLLLLLYVALPIVVAFILWRLRRDKTNPEQFFLLLLSLAIFSAILMVAGGGYDEFYRLRSPVDWAMIVVVFLGARDIWGAAYQRVKRLRQISVSPSAADPVSSLAR